MIVWTPERQADLERFAAEGLSASQIAKQMRCFRHCRDGGRNAIIGRAHRTGVRLLAKSPRDPKIDAAIRDVLVNGSRPCDAGRSHRLARFEPLYSRLSRVRRGLAPMP